MSQNNKNKRLLSSGNRSNNGRLTAIILSTYDLPNKLQPKNVSLETLGKRVETGPPTRRHRERNSFKFAGSKNESSVSPDSLFQNGNADKGRNDLVINAPLSQLYDATIKFTVEIEDESQSLLNQQDLSTYVKVRDVVRVNESHWLVLNLTPEQLVGTRNSSDAYECDNNIHEKNGNGNDADMLMPTIRLKIRLEGPYRPEIAAALSASNTWFQTIDNFNDAFHSSIYSFVLDLPSKFPSSKILLIPMVPIAATIVAFTPLILGIFVIGLPFFLPLLIMILGVILAVFAAGVGLYFSTSCGREKFASIFSPALATFLHTPSGQTVVYDVGPRLSPVTLIQSILPSDMTGKLLTSLLIDFIGSSSYLLPVVGEGCDLIWAPVQTIFVAAMYDRKMPSLKYISFLEEILPFTDIIPSATIGWMKEFSPVVMDMGKRQARELTVVAGREVKYFRKRV